MNGMNVRIIPSDEHGNVLETLNSEWFETDGHSRVTIPAGFRSDGASVPRFLWSLVSPAIDPHTIEAAIYHDYLYRTPSDYTRREADKLFAVICILNGFPRWKAYLAYIGLRLFGWTSWKGGSK